MLGRIQLLTPASIVGTFLVFSGVTFVPCAGHARDAISIKCDNSWTLYCSIYNNISQPLVISRVVVNENSNDPKCNSTVLSAPGMRNEDNTPLKEHPVTEGEGVSVHFVGCTEHLVHLDIFTNRGKYTVDYD
jgi:hypothetical protein